MTSSHEAASFAWGTSLSGFNRPECKTFNITFREPLFSGGGSLLSNLYSISGNITYLYLTGSNVEHRIHL